ncbi:hypothetical protein QTG54_013424 [Skeletonema marinoi]|uniref:WRKY19-like zinc finger domain-containing protein n=1 Tax=Skeletonema marinoi TaxID=267567 RepID=A0AAD9D7L4_9STRA|nr:hypothetical protein QTG54_013424 [Skeletonema marinoi]
MVRRSNDAAVKDAQIMLIQEEHGAKRKRCNSDGCTNNVVNGGVCKRHGAKVEYKRCNSEGCTNVSVKGGVCVKHGANLKRCRSKGCTNYAQKGGVCIKHGQRLRSKNVAAKDAQIKPSVEECVKGMQRRMH